MWSSLILQESGCAIIAEKTDISLFLSALRSNNLNNSSIFLFDSTDTSSLYFENEITKISEKYKYKNFFSQALPQKADFVEIIKKSFNKQIYIAGSQDFVNNITSILVDNKVSPKKLNYGETYPQTEQGKKLEKQFF